MSKYYITHQISTIKNNSTTYLYNWYNGLGVEIDNTNIVYNDKNEIMFSKDFNDENINYLMDKIFINKIENDIVQKHNLIDQIIHIERNKNRIVLMPSGYLCNFRCKYCYENHDNSNYYTDDDINIIKNFVLKFNKPQIEYFGGEPLLNYKWILKLQDMIKNHIQFSSITTNGFLLSKDLFNQLLDSKLLIYQITIDGIEKDHNYLRPLKNGGKTFKTILSNIENTKNINKDFIIYIRINFNNKNISNDKINEFFDYISFASNDRRYRLFFKPISLYSELNNTTTDDIKNTIYNKSDDNLLKDILINAQERKYLIADVSMLSKKAGLICYASKDNNYVINDNKEILKCTLALNNKQNILGLLSNCEKIKYDDLNKKWSINKNNILDRCLKCFLLYQCLGAVCPAKKIIKDYYECPTYVLDELFYVNLIRKQKQILKEIKNGNKNI